jgi:hypothetical protein
MRMKRRASKRQRNKNEKPRSIIPKMRSGAFWHGESLSEACVRIGPQANRLLAIAAIAAVSATAATAVTTAATAAAKAAATAATAAAAITTAAAATTAAATPAIFARTRFVHGEGSAVMLLPIQGRNRGGRFLIGSHFDKTKAFAPAGVTVIDDLSRHNLAMRRKQLFEFRAIDAVAQVPDVQLLTHWVSPLMGRPRPVFRGFFPGQIERGCEMQPMREGDKTDKGEAIHETLS